MRRPGPQRHAWAMTRPTPPSQSPMRGLVPWFRYGYTDQHIRVSDAERTEVADRLAAHFAEGRLNQGEFDERVAQTMNAKTRGDLSGLFDDLPEPGPAGTPGMPVRGGQHSPAHPARPHVNPFFLVLLVVVITAVGTAGEAASREGWLPGVKTWLTIGVITAIVVYAAGMLRHSRAAREK
jgi:Domain of unknown function (DUF1707)